MTGQKIALRKALERAQLALDDWLHTYADEHCDKDDVARSRSRIVANGGTLAYIAKVQEHIKWVLALTKQ
jgi:hypothetical protein